MDGKTGNLIEKKHVFSLYIVFSEVHLQMTLLSEIQAAICQGEEFDVLRNSNVQLSNWKVIINEGLICRNSNKSFASGIYLYKSLKRGICTDKSLIYNQIQFISAALPCYIIKPSSDFQLVNIQRGYKLNKGC